MMKSWDIKIYVKDFQLNNCEMSHKIYEYQLSDWKIVKLSINSFLSILIFHVWSSWMYENVIMSKQL